MPSNKIIKKKLHSKKVTAPSYQKSVIAKIKKNNIKKEMSNERRDLPKDILVDLYVKKGLSTIKIGSLLGCHQRCVSGRLRAYKIPTRGSRGTIANGHKKSSSVTTSTIRIAVPHNQIRLYQLFSK